MKDKFIMAFSIGFVAIVFTILIVIQLKTVVETDIIAIETMRETELRTELANWKTKYEEVDTEIHDVDELIGQYKEELNNNANASNLLDTEVRNAEKYMGYTAVQGQGIIITLSDGEIFNIEYDDLLILVNELNAAGAEAISINDERIVSPTDFSVVANKFILVNSSKLSGPYVIKAIGDKKYLESAISIKGGFIDEIAAKQKNITYALEDNIQINGYDKEIKFIYSKEYVEEED